MARPKTKEGRKVSFYMAENIAERLDRYCEEVGQSKTLAVERILGAYFNEYFSSGETGQKIDPEPSFRSR